MRIDKAKKYLALAHDLAQRHSKDRSTKVGAYLVHPTEFTELTRGYNGMPRGANDEAHERHERPVKYDYFTHAETNAIFNKVRPQLKGSLCLTTKLPTIADMRAAISVGAQALYFPRAGLERLPVAEREQFDRGMALLRECRVRVHDIEGDLVQDTARRARKLTALLAHERVKQELFAKDPRASSAVFVVPDDYTVLTSGYSGLPRGMDDAMLERYEGANRALWVEGAIRNAIYNLARASLRGSTAVVTLIPCADCARGLVASGVEQIFAAKPTAEQQARWGDSFAVSRRVLDELKVPLIEL
jgi:dCMP deaminase